MTLRNQVFLGALTGTLLCAAAASAQTADGFSINRFQPAERGSDWFAADSLDLRGRGRLAIGVVGDWAHRPLVIYDANGDYVRAPISNQVALHLGAAINLADRIRFAFSLPVLAVNRGVPGTVDGVRYAVDKGGAVGDLRLSGDIRLFGNYGDAFTTAVGVQVHLPTGSQAAYASDGKVRLVPRWLAAGDIGAFTYGASLGFDGRFRTQDFGQDAFGPEMTFTAAAGVRVANKRVVIGPELYGSTVVSDGGDGFMKKRTTPVELLFGTHARLGDFQVGAGVGPGISRGVGAPDFRVVASLTWFPEPAKPQPVVPPTDRDEDGIADGADACPDVAGPKNDDPTKNGCPPPPDRDQDGIIDSEDACPDEAGPRNEDPTKNGCPPPPDRDQDGIIDSEDACPDEAGVRSDDPKKNGCPPPKDTDGDGITDDIDACVKDPGPRNEDPKKNGCPKAIMVADEVKILDRIEFDVDKATLRPESESILQAVADILQAHPEIAKIQIQGHTDNKGARAHNQNLSQRRANAVMKWLTLKGIDAKRLEARGFGQDQPIDANTTDAGRQNNRRVQFIITNKADASTQTAPGAANSGTSTGTKAP